LFRELYRTDKSITSFSQGIKDFNTVRRKELQHVAETQNDIPRPDHVKALQDAVNKLKSVDSFTAPLYTLLHNTGYMVALTRGRADYNASLALVTKHFTAELHNLGDGYRVKEHTHGWEISK